MLKFKILLLIPLLLLSFTTEPGGKQPLQLTVATASSLALPLEQIVAEFEERRGIEIRLVSASSGVIATQVLHGAPFDLFISADMSYPQKIYQKGISSTPPEVITRGALALWSKMPLQNQNYQTLLDSTENLHLAIANPDLAPFGRAAAIWLRDQNLYQKTKPTLVYGQNVGQVNHIIHSGAADFALTSASAMHTPQLQKRGYWKLIINPSASSIPHGAILLDQQLTNRSVNNFGERFLNFLHSPTAQAIFKQFGYQSTDLIN